jgi:hypothetical protein
MIRFSLFGVIFTAGKEDAFKWGHQAGWQQALFAALEVQQATARKRQGDAVEHAEKVRIGELPPPSRCLSCNRLHPSEEDPRTVLLDDVRSSLEVLLRKRIRAADVAAAWHAHVSPSAPSRC